MASVHSGNGVVNVSSTGPDELASWLGRMESYLPVDDDGMLDRWFVSDLVRRHGIELSNWDECIPVQDRYVADAVFAALGY